MRPAVLESNNLESLATGIAEASTALQLDAMGSDELTWLLDSARSIQAAAEALVVRIGLRADHLAASGRGAPARDTFIGRGQVRGSTARREATRVQLARRSPAAGRAMTSGQLGADHLDALTRRLGRLDDERLARLDLERLLRQGEALPADSFDAALRRAVDAVNDTEQAIADAETVRAQSSVRHWFDDRTGLGHLSATLDPERYEAVANAIDQHTASLAANADGARTKDPALAADALVDLICSSGARQAHLPHLTVVVDEATLARGHHEASIAQTGNGHDLPIATIQRLACDSVLRRVVLSSQGVPIDVGRRSRTATDAQWAALRALHTSCAWAGCDRPLSHCQAHHIQPWQDGGPTDLANLVPLCSHHHHLVHEGRWRIRLGPDRSLTATQPDGRRSITATPPTRRPPPLERDAA